MLDFFDVFDVFDVDVDVAVEAGHGLARGAPRVAAVREERDAVTTNRTTGNVDRRPRRREKKTRAPIIALWRDVLDDSR